jgi:hypothetical protein
MADPVGTTLGALGLRGLMTVCLDCFDRVQPLLGNFFHFERQFSALCIRLFAWAMACGFMNACGYGTRLDNPARKRLVQNQFNCISRLSLNTNKIVTTYQLRERYDSQRSNTMGPNALFINDSMHLFLKRIMDIGRDGNFSGAFFWALEDKKDFQDLLKCSKECIEELESVAKNLDLFEAARPIVKY